MSVIAPRDRLRYVASGERGVAYAFWEHIQRRLYEQGLDQKWLVEHSRVSAMTLNRLRAQRNPPRTETIIAIADALNIDRDEAGRLAGRLPAKPQVHDGADDPIAAVMGSPLFLDEQKASLVQAMRDMLAANRLYALEAGIRSDDDKKAI
jgi:transcriptional regulator with XRE-family HTH domain